MATVFDRIASLREVLFSLEEDLGISDLNRNEVDVLCAVSALARRSSDPIPSEAIREHRLVAHMSQPTYNRALKSLIEKGYVAHPPNMSGRKYIPGVKMVE